MIVLDVQQGSSEWVQARCGVPTASCFDMIITSKGEPSKQRQKYLYKLAGEKVIGLAEETYKNEVMLRGTDLEEEARKFYQLVTDTLVSTVGFCLSDDLKCGSSPDGLVEESGGIEIKCPSLAVHVGYLIDNKLPCDYYQQVQGNLLVTGRKWWDFVSYYPGIKPLIVRVEPDHKFQTALKNELNAFAQELDEVVKKIKGE